MAKYILRLARFIDEDESYDLIKKLQNMNIDAYSSKARHKIIRANIDDKGTSVLSKISALPEIASIEKIIFERERIDNLSELIELLAKHIPNNYNLQAKIEQGVKFHKRAIQERLAKKKIMSSELSDDNFVLDAYFYNDDTYATLSKKVNLSSSSQARSSDKKTSQSSSKQISSKKYVFVLEHVTNPHEIADFMRLGLIFSSEVFLIKDKDGETESAYHAAQKLFKGEQSQKLKVTLVDYIEDLHDYKIDEMLGFSLWGKKTDSDIPSIVSSIDSEKIALLFGNEKRGLELKTLEQCSEVIHLGPKSSEPFKANQAASYFMGHVSASK